MLNVRGTVLLYHLCVHVLDVQLTRLIRYCLADSAYPQVYLIVNETGVHLAGFNADLNPNFPANIRPPLAVDTISRYVYWYHESTGSIARQSLNHGSMDVQVCRII